MAEIWKVDDSRMEAAIEYSVRLIHSGRVVSFPTDTFYALGADPFNLAAVSEVFRIKGRAPNHPLPLLVSSLDQAADLTSNPPGLFFRLAEKYWPGPLTLVVPASQLIPYKVTGNTGKVGLRCPKASFALELIKAAGRPLTGTSANLTEHPACSTATEVDGQVGRDLPLILDAGPSGGEMASTVVDLCGECPRILRRGLISEEDLQELFG